MYRTYIDLTPPLNNKYIKIIKVNTLQDIETNRQNGGGVKKSSQIYIRN